MPISSHPLYAIWAGMVKRCTRPAAANYPHYGGRGISIFPPWRESLDRFASDLIAEIGPRPSPSHSLDRKDNDKDYAPGNVRWATQSEQLRNTRFNFVIAIDGIEKCLAEWSRESGVPIGTIKRRLARGWDLRRAVFERPAEVVTKLMPGVQTEIRQRFAAGESKCALARRFCVSRARIREILSTTRRRRVYASATRQSHGVQKGGIRV